jgi:AcrR family transcriptional regulator
MARRKDGLATRDKILKAAGAVFAERGYHDATVEEICKRAEANIAAVNYHFGSKDALYAQVWRHAFDEAMTAYPPEGGLGPDALPEHRLRGSIHSILGKTIDPGRLGHAGQILLRELVSPTEAIEQVKHDALEPMHGRMENLMRELLGPKATREQMRLCGMSVLHQCMAMGIRMFKGRIPPEHRFDLPTAGLIEMLTDHITRFSLAGIKAVRDEIEAAEIAVLEDGAATNRQ